MIRKKGVVLAVLIIGITLGFIGTMGIHPASADPGTEVFVYPPARTNPYANNTLLTYQVRLDTTSGNGAPHVTTEPAVATDKTWAWEVVINYDPNVISIEAGQTPYRHTTRDWFGFFHKYFWDEDMMEWEDQGSYDNFWAGAADDSKGEVAATGTMMEDITTRTVETGDEPHPQAALHAGSKYDLPWSDGLQGLAGYTYNYFILYLFKVRLIQAIDPAENGTILSIAAADFYEYDKVTKYSVSTTDATIGTPSAVPEFPLGLGLVMLMAPAIPIVYLWRARRKRW